MRTKYYGVQGARAYGISRTFARISETLPPQNPWGSLCRLRGILAL